MPAEVRSWALDQLGQHYRRYRLPDPEAEADMVGSLRRYGQLTPVVVCRREETHEILDGFKRLAAARALGLETLRPGSGRPTSAPPRPPSTGSTRPAAALRSGKTPGSFTPWSATTA